MTVLVWLFCFLQVAQSPLKVSGHVVPGPEGSAENAIVILSNRDNAYRAITAADGTFVFNGVMPGTYELVAVQGRQLSHSSTLPVAKDLDGIGLLLASTPKSWVFGFVSLNEGAAACLSKLKIELRSTRSSTPYTFDVETNGSFRLEVVEGEYQFGFQNLPSNCVAKSMNWGSHDLTKETLRLADTPGSGTRKWWPSVEVTLGVR